MSFCSDIKNELGNIRPSDCCKLPLTYGFLLFSRSFSAKKISMQTENLAAAKLYARLLKSCYGAEVQILSGGGKRVTYRAFVPSEADRLKILASVDYGIADGKINRECFVKDCCPAAFIRGAFLACGQISDPEKAYRADFSVRDESLAQEFCKLLSEHFVKAGISKRQSGYTVYIKRSEMIINLLTVMGASARSLEFIETTIMKDVKNNINRARNCDSGNITKTVNAAFAQTKAIEYLEKTGRLENLPPELTSAAELRKKDPVGSLSQLVKQSSEAITVSGLNHRLRRIIEIYEKHSQKH